MEIGGVGEETNVGRAWAIAQVMAEGGCGVARPKRKQRKTETQASREGCEGQEDIRKLETGLRCGSREAAGGVRKELKASVQWKIIQSSIDDGKEVEAAVKFRATAQRKVAQRSVGDEGKEVEAAMEINQGLGRQRRGGGCAGATRS